MTEQIHIRNGMLQPTIEFLTRDHYHQLDMCEDVDLLPVAAKKKQAVNFFDDDLKMSQNQYIGKR